jgi:hypothetical protein
MGYAVSAILDLSISKQSLYDGEPRFCGAVQSEAVPDCDDFEK